MFMKDKIREYIIPLKLEIIFCTNNLRIALGNYWLWSYF